MPKAGSQLWRRNAAQQERQEPPAPLQGKVKRFVLCHTCKSYQQRSDWAKADCCAQEA